MIIGNSLMCNLDCHAMWLHNDVLLVAELPWLSLLYDYLIRLCMHVTVLLLMFALCGSSPVALIDL